MVKRNSSKKPKQSRKTSRKGEHNEKKSSAGSKRQPSGYLIFCAEQRTRRKAEFEKMKPKEIMQYLGAEWRKLSTQQQDSYKAKVHHNTSNKEESKSHRNQTQIKAVQQLSGTKSKSNTKSNFASKKKERTQTRKKTNEKSTCRKANQNEDGHATSADSLI